MRLFNAHKICAVLQTVSCPHNMSSTADSLILT